MKILIGIIFVICFNSIFPQEYEKILFDSSYQYKLLFLGSDRNINQMREEFACAHSIFVNIPLDTLFKYAYPNPCSPSMLNQTFIFKVPEITDIKIVFTDSNDSIYFDAKYEMVNSGYYYFQINNEYLFESSISKDALSEYKSYKIIFSIKDNYYAVPLSKINSKI